MHTKINRRIPGNYTYLLDSFNNYSFPISELGLFLPNFPGFLFKSVHFADESISYETLVAGARKVSHSFMQGSVPGQEEKAGGYRN